MRSEGPENRLDDAVAAALPLRPALLSVARLNRDFKALLRARLDRIGVDDISVPQLILLMAIDEMQVRDRQMFSRLSVLGANVSYSIEKLRRAGYLCTRRSVNDRRKIHLVPTARAIGLLGMLDAMDRETMAELPGSGSLLEQVNPVLAGLERLLAAAD